MFSRMWIYEIIFFGGLACATAKSLFNSTSCEIFEQGAAFDPYEIVDSQWKIIYFWSNNVEINLIIFSLLSKKRLKKFRDIIEAIEPRLAIEWHKVVLLMEPRPGVQVLLLHAGSPTAFRGVVKIEQRKEVRPNPEPLIKFADIRLKIKGRYMGMMCCEDFTAFALARLDEIPATEEECVAAAASLGLEGPGGRSHFYLDKLRSEL